MTRQPLCELRDLEEGEINAFGDYILVKSGDKVYCYKDLCTHQDVKLSDFGELIAGEIVCHAHNGKFCLENGKASCLPAREPLTSYDISIEDGKVYLS